MSVTSVFKAIFNASPVPSLLLEVDPPHFMIADVNMAYLNATKSRRKDLIGRELFRAIPGSPGTERELCMHSVRRSLGKVVATKQAHEMEVQQYDIPIHAEKATDIRYWKTVNTPVLGGDDEVDYIINTVTDVTEKEKLKLTEQKLRDIIEHSTNMFYTHTADGVLNYVSPQCSEFFGYSPDESLRPWTDFITDLPENRIGIESTQKAVETGKRQPPYELQLQKTNGELIWVKVNETPIVKGGETVEIVGSLTDITDAKNHEQELMASLKEKEALLAEIHHRVKNNLAVVSGMMQLQVAEEENAVVIDRLFNSVTRIKTMAGIHEQLYQSKSFSKLEFSENIRTLILNILKTYQPEREIHVDFNCEDIEMNINQAIPCSLIINEVVTNILKHAFPDGRKGEIQVNLYRGETDDDICLVIKDNGVGLPEPLNAEKRNTIGLTLIDVLSRQLQADYRFESNGIGAAFKLRFEKSEMRGSGNNIFL